MWLRDSIQSTFDRSIRIEVARHRRQQSAASRRRGTPTSFVLFFFSSDAASAPHRGRRRRASLVSLLFFKKYFDDHFLVRFLCFAIGREVEFRSSNRIRSEGTRTFVCGFDSLDDREENGGKRVLNQVNSWIRLGYLKLG